MRTISKIFLLFETIICFGPVLIILVLGLIMSPFFIANLLQEFNSQNLYIVLNILPPVIGGLIGMVGLISMLMIIIEPETQALTVSKIHVFSAIGILSIIFYGYQSYNSNAEWSIWSLILMLPLIASIHIIWLGHRVLRAHANKIKSNIE